MSREAVMRKETVDSQVRGLVAVSQALRPTGSETQSTRHDFESRR
jgi:hypothetical protein